MRVTAITLVASLAGLYLGDVTNVTAQEHHFDHMDAKEAVVESVIHHGKQAYKNGHGEILMANPAYELSLEQRINQGYTVVVSGADASQMKSSDSEGSKFNLTFLDVVNNTNKGFDDPNLGEQRRNVLSKAFGYFAAIIDDQGTADIEIQESFFQSNNAPFAYSASYYFSSKGFNDGLVATHLINGYDPAAGLPDGFIKFNFGSGFNYNYSLNSAPSGSQYDFYTVALHEILHVLGFTSFCAQDGTSESQNDYVFTSFDEHLLTGNFQNFFIKNGQGAQVSVTPIDVSFITNNQMLWDVDGASSPVYSPSSYGGSSIDHFDNSRTQDGEFLMHPTLSKGKRVGILHHNEAIVLQKLGYSVDIGLATSVNDGTPEELNLSTRIYPNPAAQDGEVYVNIEGGVGQREILVIVYDMMGREAYTKVVLTEGDGVITAIDPYHNLAPGMYIVIGSTDDELFNQKLMIMDYQGNVPLGNR